MSTIGTGIAAGVANATTAARTQTANQSGREAQRADHAGQTDKLTITQLHDASAARDTDEDLPDQQAPGYEDLYHGEGKAEEEDPNANDQIHDADAPASSESGIPLAPSYGPGAKDHPLFHMLDVKA